VIVPIGKRGNHVISKDKRHHTGVFIQHQGVGASQISKSGKGTDFKQLLAHAINPAGGAAVLVDDAANSSALCNPAAGKTRSLCW